VSPPALPLSGDDSLAADGGKNHPCYLDVKIVSPEAASVGNRAADSKRDARAAS
jgi:hypothetical protein